MNHIAGARRAPGWDALACIFGVLIWGAPGPADAMGPEPTVELQCKIVPAAQGGTPSAWLFQLRRPSGELVHLQTVLDGETVTVRGLRPQIYIGCIAGAAGREACASMDLHLPEKGTSVRVTRELAAPETASVASDRHVVPVASLAVPREASLQMVLAEKAQLQGDSGKYAEHLKRALEIYPDYPEALNNLGAYYYRSGRIEEAVALLTRATGLDPDMYAAWVNLAGSLITGLRFDEAITAVQRALELRPNDALVNARAGLAYYYKREYGTAGKYFLRSLELDPAAASTPQLFLAHIALGEGRHQDAAEYLRHYLDVHPNAPDAELHRRTLRSIERGTLAGLAVVQGRPAD